MMAERDRSVRAYMAENNGGKCMYKPGKCDGLCNNCPHDHTMEIEREKAAGTYVADYSRDPVKHGTYYGCDYEDAILARQELLDF